MKLSYRVFWLPKSGSTAEEYEDAYSPETAPDADLDEFRCSVADGATETSFSGLWARILCIAYNDRNFDLAELQAKWLKDVSGKELPWYAEQKLESGAFATILGLDLRDQDKKLKWSARALGDSCLFHLRGSEILTALPLTKWEEFDYTPMLISSRQQSNLGVLEKQEHETGEFKKGDVFYLMTDAISKWFLRREAEHKDAVATLEAISDKDQFQQFCDSERQAKDCEGRVLMPNDDVTWTRVEVLRN